MGEVFGEGTYDFVPQTFVLPDELDGFLNAFKRQDPRVRKASPSSALPPCPPRSLAKGFALAGKCLPGG